MPAYDGNGYPLMDWRDWYTGSYGYAWNNHASPGTGWYGSWWSCYGFFLYDPYWIDSCHWHPFAGGIIDVHACASHVPQGYVDSEPWYDYSIETVEPVDELELVDLYLELGETQFREGNYAIAAEYFELAVKTAPGLAGPRFALADARIATGDHAIAAFMIGEGVEIDPDWLRLDHDLRDFYGDDTDFYEHRDAVEAAWAETTDSLALCIVSGYISFFTSEYEAAEAAFVAARRLDAANTTAAAFLENLAVILR